VKFSRKTTPGVQYGAWAIAVFVGLLASLMLRPSCAYGQAEIDPDHFDSPNTEQIPQPRTADRKVTRTRYDRAFSLPYSVLCNGKKLAPGKYSISLRSDGNVGHARLTQTGHAIEIVGVVQMKAPKQHDEAVVVENNKNGRTLSVVRGSGFDFVFDPKHTADLSPESRPTSAEKLPLVVVAPNEIAKRAPSQAPPKP
jgi:hypothetical protein